MARRKRKTNNESSAPVVKTSQGANGSAGYSKEALAALERGSYSTFSGNRNPNYTRSEDQQKVVQRVPALKGMTPIDAGSSNNTVNLSFGKKNREENQRLLAESQNHTNDNMFMSSRKSNDTGVLSTRRSKDEVRNSGVDTERARKKYAEKNNYKPIGRGLDKEDADFLYKIFDLNRTSSGGKHAIVHQLTHNMWHDTDDWEKKYGKTVEQIVDEYAADFDKISERKEKEYGDKHPILSTLQNVITGGTAEPAVDTMSTIYGKIAPNGNLTKATRKATEEYAKKKAQKTEGVTSGMSDAGKSVYNFVTPLAERAIEYATPSKLKYILQGGKTAENTRQSLKERGVEGKEAEAMSLGAGVLDAYLDYEGFEAIPFLKGLVNSGKIGKEILGRAAIGGGEQALTYALTQLLDRGLIGDKSEHAIKVAQYKATGLSDEEAEKQANIDDLKELGIEGLSGAALNNLMGFGGRAAKGAYDTITGRNIPSLWTPDVNKVQEIPTPKPNIPVNTNTIEVPDYAKGRAEWEAGRPKPEATAPEADNTPFIYNDFPDAEVPRTNDVIDDYMRENYLDPMREEWNADADIPRADIITEEKATPIETNKVMNESAPGNPRLVKPLEGAELEEAQAKLKSNNTEISTLQQKIDALKNDPKSLYRGKLKKAVEKEIKSYERQIKEIKKSNTGINRQIKGKPTPVKEQLSKEEYSGIYGQYNSIFGDLYVARKLAGDTDEARAVEKECKSFLNDYVNTGDKNALMGFVQKMTELDQLGRESGNTYKTKDFDYSYEDWYADDYSDMGGNLATRVLSRKALAPVQAIHDANRVSMPTEAPVEAPKLEIEDEDFARGVQNAKADNSFSRTNALIDEVNGKNKALAYTEDAEYNVVPRQGDLSSMDVPHQIAERMAKVSQDFDTYGYMDDIHEMDGFIERIAEDISTGRDLSSYIDSLSEIIDETDDPNLRSEAQSLIDELSSLQEDTTPANELPRYTADVVNKTQAAGGGMPPEPPKPPKGPEDDISQRYTTLKNSDLFQKSQANMKMLERAKKEGVFNKDIEGRAEAQQRALDEYVADPTKATENNLNKQWTSGQDLDTSMLVLHDALNNESQAYTNLVLLKQAQQTTSAGRVLRAALDYAKKNYAGTKEGTLQEAAKFLNSKAEKLLSNRKTAEQFDAIATRIMNGDLSDLSKRFDMDDINIQNIKDALEAGAGKADIAHMIAMYQEVGKTGISQAAIDQITDIYNEIQSKNLKPNSRARANLEADAFKILAQDIGGKRSWAEKWDAWRYLAMLGNPKTHLRNILGNTTHYMVTEAKDALGAALEGAVDTTNKAFGGKGIDRTKALLGQKDKGLVDLAAKDADDVAYAALNDSGNKYNVRNEIDRARPSFNNKVLSKIDDLNSNLLDVEDYSALKRKYSRSLARFLKANGADKSIFDATDDASVALLDRARNYAIDQAKQATFHEYSKTAEWLNRFSKEAREGDFRHKAGAYMLEGVMPFKKTPINILKQGIKYSPVSLAKGVGKMLSAVKSGNATASEAIEDLASGLTGSGIMALGYLLAHEGILNGAANPDYDVDNAETAQGKQNYAIQIGDKSYTLDWLAPMSMPLFVGAELSRLFGDEGDDGETATNKFIQGLSTIAEPITEMSMLQGINNVLQELSYSPVNALGTLAATTGLGYFTQGVPTLAGQFARALDDTRRSTYSNKTGMDKMFDKALTKVENKIPYLSMGNQPYIDARGNEEKNNGVFSSNLGNNFGTRLLDQMLSPGYYKEGNVRSLDEELNRLYEATGEDVYENVSSGKVLDQKLSKEAFTDYQRLYGSNTDYFYNEIIKNAAYQNMDDAERVKALNEAKSISRMIADHEVGGRPLKDSEQKKYDIYKSQGKEGIVKYLNDKATAESLGMDYNTYTKKNAEVPGGAEQWAQDKQAAQDLGFVTKSGNVQTDQYEKVLAKAGTQAAKMQNDLPALVDMGLEKSAFYTYANAINVIPSLTPTEFAQTYKEINYDTSNAMTQKELLEYINSFDYDDPREAEELWSAYGGWTNKAGVPKKIKMVEGVWKSYY